MYQCRTFCPVLNYSSQIDTFSKYGKKLKTMKFATEDSCTHFLLDFPAAINVLVSVSQWASKLETASVWTQLQISIVLGEGYPAPNAPVITGAQPQIALQLPVLSIGQCLLCLSRVLSTVLSRM